MESVKQRKVEKNFLVINAKETVYKTGARLVVYKKTLSICNELQRWLIQKNVQPVELESLKRSFPPNKNVSDGLQSYCRSCKKKSYVRKPRQKTDNLSKVQQSLLEITETTTKQCSKCEEHKLLDGFGRRKDGLYGRQNWCKACRKVYDAQRQEARFDHIQKVQQKWKAENREKVVEQRKKYRHTPEGREAIKRSEAKRRALEYDAFIEDIPQSFIDILLSRQNNYCRYCLLDFNLEPFYTVEHIVPLTRGGKEEKLNIQLVCGSCNSSKLTKTHEEFLVYLRQGLGPKFLRWAK